MTEDHQTDPKLIKSVSTDATNSEFIYIDPYNSDQIADSTVGIYTPKEKLDPNKDNFKGVPSIMNSFAIVTLKGAYDNGKMNSLLDKEGRRRWYEDYNYELSGNEWMGRNNINPSKEPTVQKLIEFGKANKRGTTPYYYSDFAYCKYFGKIPNNYLITLRRYAVPTYDSLDFPFYNDDLGDKLQTVQDTIKENGKTKKINYKTIDDKDVMNLPDTPQRDEFTKAPPIAQAVTWMGAETGNTFENIMSFSVNMPWEELKANTEPNTENYGDANDATNMPGLLGKLGKSMGVLTGEAQLGGALRTDAPPDPYADGPYANRILGPVNRIDSVYRRVPPLEFNQEISLNFHYVMRSIGGINSKAAMLDIISNFLLLTYGVGAFWGGSQRYLGGSASYPWKRGMAAWYSGNPVKFGEVLTDSFASIGNRLSSLFDNLLSDPLGTLKSIANTGFSGAMRAQIGGHAPMFHGFRALLTGEPTGPWHLVIGNPLNPIMMIGNLICDGCDFKFGGEMGVDDFPTELTITVKLKHAMSRDRYGVESMFNKGAGRIYTLPDGLEKNLAGNVESKVDKNTGNIIDGKRTDEIKKSNISYLKEADWNDIKESGVKAYNTWMDNGTNLARNMELGYYKTNKQK